MVEQGRTRSIYYNERASQVHVMLDVAKLLTVPKRVTRGA